MNKMESFLKNPKEVMKRREKEQKQMGQIGKK